MDEADIAEQLDRLLAVPQQSWLLGAGVSYDAKIPLMYPLTARALAVFKDLHKADVTAIALIDSVVSDVGATCHIEHYLSHFQDLHTVADRSHTKAATIGGQSYEADKIKHTHMQLLQIISVIVRWGYSVDGTGAESVGQHDAPIVDVTHHRDFVRSIFSTGRAGLSERRGPVRFFTTNYDTLLEDALAIEGHRYADGFEGGAVAFWAPETLATNTTEAVVYKIHGSVDWRRTPDGKLLRTRLGDLYPGTDAPVLIYPQATKYVASRRDPFELLFRMFRENVYAVKDQVVLTCGYSFGDDHINGEIEEALISSGNNTTAILFLHTDTPGKFPHAVRNLRMALQERIYILTPYGLYRGSDGPFFAEPGGSLGWWSFTGATKLLRRGSSAFIKVA